MLGSLLGKLGFGKLAHNTALNVLWQAGRVGLQAAWIVAAAWVLGAAEYGKLAGLAGFAVTLGAFVGWGTGYLLLQGVSREPAMLGPHWHRALRIVLVTGLVLCLAFAGIAHRYVNSGVELSILVAIGLAELVCVPLVNTASFAFQARERLGWSGAVVTLLSGLRLVSVLGLGATVGTATLSTYAGLHLAASILSALFALYSVRHVLRPTGHGLKMSHRDFRTGAAYATAWSAGTATSELDKTLSLQFAGAEANGVYSVAYRFASVLTLPVASLVLAAQPRLFRLGATTGGSGASPLPAIVGTCILLGSIASVCLLAFSYAIPAIFGAQFEASAHIARTLSLLPPLYALRLIGSTVLMTSGRQIARILVDASGALLMSVLALRLLPEHGISVMAWIMTGVEAWLALWAWILVWRTPRRHTRPPLGEDFNHQISDPP
ncbi:lipopolysaccharide biosynthesis protein [Pseudoxanthomonas japonensis]|nr:lipopolysaccharide biosynthesis protein [Pseudoxanthomonas japonensis]